MYAWYSIWSKSGLFEGWSYMHQQLALFIARCATLEVRDRAGNVVRTQRPAYCDQEWFYIDPQGHKQPRPECF